MAPRPDGASAAATPCTTLISAAFNHLHLHLPRRPPPHPHRPSSPIDAAAASLSTATASLFDALRSAASDHPFLKPLLSLPADLRTFLQVGCRTARVPPSPLSSHNFAAILPGDSVAGLVAANGLNSFLNIYNTLLVVRLVLTWFPNSPPAIVSPLSTICDPYLNIFRGIIPPLGGTLDLSPILAFLVLNAITSTAAALPAELPTTTGSQEGTLSTHPMLDLTRTQEKWMRRLCCKRLKNSDDVK